MSSASILVLNLSNNTFTDDGAIKLMHPIRFNRSIKRLILYHNNLTGQSIEVLCKVVASHPSINSLNLDLIELDAPSQFHIKSMLISPSCGLKSLHLSKVGLNNDGLCKLVDSLRFNSSLTELDLSHNKFDQIGLGRCLGGFFGLFGLKSLNLGHNMIGSNGPHANIPEKLLSKLKLHSLQLSAIGLGHCEVATIRAFSTSLECNSTLEFLDLSKNHLDDNRIAFIASSLRWNQSIKRLDLSQNHLMDNAALALSLALLYNNRLKVLILYGNQIRPIGAKSLVDSLKINYNLIVLDMRKNLWDSEWQIAESLNQNIAFNRKLHMILLPFDRANAYAIDCRCSIVRVNKFCARGLLVNNNPVAIGCGPLETFNNITILYLNSMELEMIADPLLKLVHLWHLDLSNNRISFIPLEIGNLYKLEVLKISHNRLECLPYSLVYLPLKILTVHHNDLSLIPPKCLGLSELFAMTFKETKLFKYLHTLSNSQKENVRIWRTKLMVMGSESLGPNRIDILKHLADTHTALPEPLVQTNSVSVYKIKNHRHNHKEGRSKSKRNQCLTWNCYNFNRSDPTQIFFASAKAISLVVFNASKFDENESSQIEYWVQFIQSRGKPSFIFLVGVYEDKINLSKYHLEVLNERYVKCRTILEIFLVNLRKSSDSQWKHLKKRLFDTAVKYQLAGNFYSKSVKKIIHSFESSKKPYISLQTLKTFIINSGVKRKMLSQIIHLLTDIGCIIHFPVRKDLENYVFLSPQFLAKTFEYLLSAKVHENNIILESHAKDQSDNDEPHVLIDQIWKLFEVFNVAIRVKNHQDERNFPAQELYQIPKYYHNSHRGENIVYIVPSLLPTEMSPELNSVWNAHCRTTTGGKDLVDIERIYQFSFLPLGFFGMLVARCHCLNYAKICYPWSSGFLMLGLHSDECAKILFDSINFQLSLIAIGSDPSLLLSNTVEIIDDLLENWFPEAQKQVFLVYRSDSLKSPVFIPKTDVIRELTGGAFQIKISNFPVNLDALAPDLCLTSKKGLRANYKDLNLDVMLSQSGFSAVYRAKYFGKDVTVKLYENGTRMQHGPEDFSSMNEYLEAQRKAKERAYSELKHEVQLIVILNHPNIIELIGYSFSPPLIVTEYAPIGDVRDKLLTCKSAMGHFSFDLRMRVALDTCEAMKYLHTNNPPICHRDLSANNLLLFSSDPRDFDHPVSKLIDFSLATFFFIDSLGRVCNEKTYYLAPEILENLQQTHKSDIYSFAILLWQLWTCNYDIGINESQIKIGIRPHLPPIPHGLTYQPSFAPDLLKLIESCWASNPDSRPEFVLIAPFLRQVFNEIVAD